MSKSTLFYPSGYYSANDTGLYYCNARYYSPKWRRFISPDDTAYLNPESVNGLNLYCYCNNDSVNYVDPTGTAWYNVVWDWMNTIAGVLNPISSMTAVCSVVVAVCQGRWAEIRDDWNAGCLNPFNQSESVALKAKVLGFYKGSTIVRQDLIGTCSMFGTIWAESNISETTLRHEYGHSVQERILRKKYLSTVAIPSVSYYWYDVVTNGSSYDYYSTPWERTADWLGGVNRSCGYKKGSLAWGIVENILGPAVIPVYLLFGF